MKKSNLLIFWSSPERNLEVTLRESKLSCPNFALVNRTHYPTCLLDISLWVNLVIPLTKRPISWTMTFLVWNWRSQHRWVIWVLQNGYTLVYMDASWSPQWHFKICRWNIPLIINLLYCLKLWFDLFFEIRL